MRKLREAYQKEKGKMDERKGNFTFSVPSDYYLSHSDFLAIFSFWIFTCSSYFSLMVAISHHRIASLLVSLFTRLLLGST